MSLDYLASVPGEGTITLSGALYREALELHADGFPRRAQYFDTLGGVAEALELHIASAAPLWLENVIDETFARANVKRKDTATLMDLVDALDGVIIDRDELLVDLHKRVGLTGDVDPANLQLRATLAGALACAMITDGLVNPTPRGAESWLSAASKALDTQRRTNDAQLQALARQRLAELERDIAETPEGCDSQMDLRAERDDWICALEDKAQRRTSRTLS